jgi:hypothetical protein
MPSDDARQADKISWSSGEVNPTNSQQPGTAQRIYDHTTDFREQKLYVVSAFCEQK